MSFRSLALVRALNRAVRFPSRSGLRDPLALHDPARRIMVDFAVVAPVVCSAEVRINDALALMKAAGVRALLVLRDAIIVGLITSSDIQGEKPVRFLQGDDCVHERCHHEDIEVADIMTPVEQLQAVSLHAMDTARVGDLFETFRQVGHTHMLVIDSDDCGQDLTVRGLLSLSDIERHLGMDPELSLSATLNQRTALEAGL